LRLKKLKHCIDSTAMDIIEARAGPGVDETITAQLEVTTQ